MSIFFCGDPHGRFEHIVKAVQQHRPEAIVILGDLQAKRPLEYELSTILSLTEVWWIHGNHDTDNEVDYDNLFASALADRNLHGRVVDIAGVRIAGLGGIFRRQIWMPPDLAKFETPEAYLAQCGKGNWWRGGLPRKHRSSIFPSDCSQLMGQGADILVSHEAPTSNAHGFQAIDELARALQVKVAFHGHHHMDTDYGLDERERLGFSIFGVGLHSIRDQIGGVIKSPLLQKHD